MSLINFWKGPESKYSQDIHGGGYISVQTREILTFLEF